MEAYQNESEALESKILNINFSNFISEKTGSYHEDYKLGGVLGEGAFAEVRKVTHRQSRSIRAMKMIWKQRL